jgi:hypothetical protein
MPADPRLIPTLMKLCRGFEAKLAELDKAEAAEVRVPPLRVVGLSRLFG